MDEVFFIKLIKLQEEKLSAYYLACYASRHGGSRSLALQTTSLIVFIDFESLKWLDGYRNIVFEFPALPILSLLHSHWLNIFDGIYYIRDIECMQLNNKTEDPENLKTE